MNNLSIDLWDKRCWLAYSNMWIIFTLPQVDRVEIIKEIKKIIIQKSISKIIIWMPFDLYQKELNQLNKTKRFIEKLKNEIKWIEIIEVDERFTTFEAIETLNILWEKNIFKKKDSLAAYFILERYLNMIKNK